MSPELKRGDVVVVDLEPIKGSETGKTRPCVVIQNDIGNKYSPVTIVAVITGQKEISKQYPTDVWISKGDGGLNKDSIVQCDQIRTITKERIQANIGHFNPNIMKDVNKALKISLSLF
ncbi:MAG TPA: type II toxin-antitoxin system PemK/MazF family toxin [Acidobacteriota bacterium]|nr:type II toxin-antitoxin system PemK/MazF family toxin [Acidobacteriota bacterium]